MDFLCTKKEIYSTAEANRWSPLPNIATVAEDKKYNEERILQDVWKRLTDCWEWANTVVSLVSSLKSAIKSVCVAKVKFQSEGH